MGQIEEKIQETENQLKTATGYRKNDLQKYLKRLQREVRRGNGKTKKSQI